MLFNVLNFVMVIIFTSLSYLLFFLDGRYFFILKYKPSEVEAFMKSGDLDPEPHIHYIDVISNEQRKQDITVLTLLYVSSTSLACLIMICLWRTYSYCIIVVCASICVQ
jgi:hypothetical protein